MQGDSLKQKKLAREPALFRQKGHRRVGFVPEGQHDSSQARSAWIATQRGPVPEGRSKSLSVLEIFVVETEPRHEQATARLP